MGRMKKIAPHWQILLALLLATGTAIVFRNISMTVAGDTQAFYFIQNAIAVSDFVGKLFIRALKMIIVPLVVSSIIAGIAGLGGVKGFGRLGMKTLGFYMSTSLIAVLIGLFLVNTIQPGLENGKANPEIRAALEQKADSATQSEKDKVAEAGKRKAMIRKIRNGNRNQRVVNEVVQFVKEMGGIEFAMEKMQNFKLSAMKILHSFPESPARDSLRDLVEYTVSRNK